MAWGIHRIALREGILAHFLVLQRVAQHRCVAVVARLLPAQEHLVVGHVGHVGGVGRVRDSGQNDAEPRHRLPALVASNHLVDADVHVVRRVQAQDAAALLVLRELDAHRLLQHHVAPAEDTRYNTRLTRCLHLHPAA